MSTVIATSNKPWTYIDAKAYSIRKHLSGVFTNWGLVRILVKRDFTVAYKQTILGPVWAVFQPLATVLTYTFVFSRIAGISTGGAPPPLFYLSGLLVWGFLSLSVNNIASVFISQSAIVSKVYFPRLVLPISTLINAAISSCFQWALFFALAVYYVGFRDVHLNIGWHTLLVPIFLLQIGLFCLGLGLTVARVTVRYRDLIHLLTFLLQLGMYTTTVIYPVTTIPERWRALILAHPITPIIEGLRYGLGLTSNDFIWGSWFFSLGITFFVLWLGLRLFSRMERVFVDYI